MLSVGELPAGGPGSGSVKLLQERMAPVETQVFGSGQASHARSVHIALFNTGVAAVLTASGSSGEENRGSWQGDKLCFLPHILLSRLVVR